MADYAQFDDPCRGDWGPDDDLDEVRKAIRREKNPYLSSMKTFPWVDSSNPHEGLKNHLQRILGPRFFVDLAKTAGLAFGAAQMRAHKTIRFHISARFAVPENHLIGEATNNFMTLRGSFTTRGNHAAVTMAQLSDEKLFKDVVNNLVVNAKSVTRPCGWDQHKSMDERLNSLYTYVRENLNCEFFHLCIESGRLAVSYPIAGDGSPVFNGEKASTVTFYIIPTSDRLVLHFGRYCIVHDFQSKPLHLDVGGIVDAVESGILPDTHHLMPSEAEINSFKVPARFPWGEDEANGYAAIEIQVKGEFERGGERPLWRTYRYGQRMYRHRLLGYNMGVTIDERGVGLDIWWTDNQKRLTTSKSQIEMFEENGFHDAFTHCAGHGRIITADDYHEGIILETIHQMRREVLRSRRDELIRCPWGDLTLSSVEQLEKFLQYFKVAVDTSLFEIRECTQNYIELGFRGKVFHIYLDNDGGRVRANMKNFHFTWMKNSWTLQECLDEAIKLLDPPAEWTPPVVVEPNPPVSKEPIPEPTTSLTVVATGAGRFRIRDENGVWHDVCDVKVGTFSDTTSDVTSDTSGDNGLFDDDGDDESFESSEEIGPFQFQLVDTTPLATYFGLFAGKMEEDKLTGDRNAFLDLIRSSGESARLCSPNNECAWHHVTTVEQAEALIELAAGDLINKIITDGTIYRLPLMHVAAMTAVPETADDGMRLLQFMLDEGANPNLSYEGLEFALTPWYLASDKGRLLIEGYLTDDFDKNFTIRMSHYAGVNFALFKENGIRFIKAELFDLKVCLVDGGYEITKRGNTIVVSSRVELARLLPVLM